MSSTPGPICNMPSHGSHVIVTANPRHFGECLFPTRCSILFHQDVIARRAGRHRPRGITHAVSSLLRCVAANGCSVRRRKLTPNGFAKSLEGFYLKGDVT